MPPVVVTGSLEARPDRDDAIPAGLALKLGIVDACDGKRGLPVCHRVEYEKVNLRTLILPGLHRQ